MSIGYQTKTIEEVVSEANLIYIEYNKTRNLDSLYVSHKDFSQTYPIVIRYIEQYNESVFRKYLTQLKPWNSEDEYINTQGEYLVMIYAHSVHGERGSRHKVQKFREKIRVSMREERNHFKEQVDELDKKIDEEDKTRASVNTEEFMEFVRRLGPMILEKSGTISVVSEEPTPAPSSLPLNVEADIVPIEHTADDLLSAPQK
jgi:hypothetical protein